MPTPFKLPTHPYINCSTPGCTSQTTCFGQNLQAKITSYGSLERLLNEFQCRGCRAKSDNKPTTVKIRKPRVSKKQTRAKLVDDLVRSIPAYKPEKNQVYHLKDSPEFVARITKESGCQRPDIFLDCDRVCDDCPYNQCCQASNKTFSKRYKLSAAA